jgi:hypothetical protein
MRVTRMDLDGKGRGSPEGLVTAILSIERDLPLPVPIEELSRQLDISEISELTTEGFEGSLLTDTTRSSGIILINAKRQRQRRRFSIGHELGHFLIPTHMPDENGRFLCSREDMRRMSAKENDRRARMEVEANRFSSLILIPPPYLRKDLSRLGGGDLQDVIKLAQRYDVSKEAMARAYCLYHQDRLAIVVCKDGRICRMYKGSTDFPFIQPQIGAPIPSGSIFYQTNSTPGYASEVVECLPDIWFDVERGKRAPMVKEQALLQQAGFAMILLNVAVRDEDEEDEEEMLGRRWHLGFSRK